MVLVKGIKNEILNGFCNSYLLWFDSLATKDRLPLSHKFFIVVIVCNKLIYILIAYLTISLFIGYATDYILKEENRRKLLSDFLKKYSTPELYSIYGNPGEAASAKLAGKLLGSKVGIALTGVVTGSAIIDHTLTHTGVWDSVSYKINTNSGMSPDQAIGRLPKNRSSILDSMSGKSS